MKWLFFNVIFIMVGVLIVIDTYKNKQIENIDNIAIYFQNPSRHLLKTTYLFDEALEEIHKYNLTKNKIYLFKAKTLLLASKKFIYKNPYLLNQNTDEIVKIIDKLLKNPTKYHLEQIMQKFHKLVDKISFEQWKKSIEYVENYKQNTIHFYYILYTIGVILLGFIIIIIAFIYQIKETKKIKLISETDQLTGAFNRRRFFKEIKECKKPCSIIMFDIDYFKKINDTYGHDKGDFVLKKLIQTIKKNIRENDMIFRWGGEEFFILFNNTNLTQAAIIAEKIRKNIEQEDFDGINITISLSVAEKKDSNIEKLIKKLDIGLYESKQNGRNKVTIKE